ncbi:Site-specific DNA recombinase [Geopseudomonas sagittaria]|uniref:Site-specific DNA recombinase n=1 Tax=Geopseudomonas sagittaria TaxID=1135990 RepID=A0A1I5W0L1_9GAMM|nr:recombinase family protein [Pseudomonas sagittaria]SFQ13308.1 Site-specific DNA recombinase [Pseudomonas sagittaria]
MEVVAYYRVSTKRQGESGLGLEAQREYVSTAAAQHGWVVVAEYTDVNVSGSVHPLERAEAAKAFTHGVPVVVAKLDRLSRDVEHIAGLMKRADFKVATMPTARTLELHLYAMLAQQEREFISQRTKEALNSLAKRAEAGDVVAQGKVANRAESLAKGRTKANQEKGGNATKAKATSFAESIRDTVELCVLRGTHTLQGVADCLNAKGVTTSRGGKWSPMQASRVMKSLGLTFS